jgi:hypothetical protein
MRRIGHSADYEAIPFLPTPLPKIVGGSRTSAFADHLTTTQIIGVWRTFVNASFLDISVLL